MKKTLLSLLFLLGMSLTIHAQQDGLRAGAHVGFPSSDASDFSSVNLGVDASYLFNVADNVAVGAATGFTSFLGKDDFDTYSFIPVAVSGRVLQIGKLFYTGDVGYAISLDKAVDGGLYYQAKLGWTNNRIDIYAFYKGISASDSSLGAFGVGAAFKLKT